MEINEGVKRAHENAKNKGFHKEPREIGTMLALIHSEVSEALEADREDKRANLANFDMYMEHTSKDFFSEWAFTRYLKDTFEDEMADIVIRVFDLCGHLGIDLERHIELKMRYNESREPLHGKNY